MDQFEKNKRISALQSLVESDGWKVLLEELQEDVTITESKLHGETPLREEETIEQLQRERIDRLDLMKLPENLIRELYEEDEGVDVEAYEGYGTKDVLEED